MLGPQTHLTARYMDLLSLTQSVTASNIANADTPGYRTLTFDFQSEFQRALEDPKAQAGESPAVFEAGLSAVKNDGNDVILERELRLMSESAIRFRHAALMLRGGIRGVRMAIQEGRGAIG